MSKIEAGRIRLDLQEMRLGRFLKDAMRVVSARADDKELTLTADISHGIRVKADNRLLKQIVLNLLSNAVKFTPERGRIIVRARASARWVRIAFLDSGIGIPKDALAKLGRPFEQVESQLTKSHQGSGLGLAIAQVAHRAARRHDAHPLDARPRNAGPAAAAGQGYRSEDPGGCVRQKSQPSDSALRAAMGARGPK